MRGFRRHAFDWAAWLLFASVPAIIFYESATSLAAKGAASGGPLENAALYPRVIATLMSIAVVAQGIRLALGRARFVADAEPTPGTRLAIVLTALFVIYLIVLPTVGYHIATPILVVVMTLSLGVRVVPAVLGGLALWLVTAYVFEGLLNVVLPVGLLNLTLFD